MPSNTTFTCDFKLLKSSVVRVGIWNRRIIVQHIEKWYQTRSVLICSKYAKVKHRSWKVKLWPSKSDCSKIECENFWANNHIHLMLSSKASPIHRLALIWKSGSGQENFFFVFSNQSWIRCRCLEITRITNMNISCFYLTERVIRKFSYPQMNDLNHLYFELKITVF